MKKHTAWKIVGITLGIIILCLLTLRVVFDKQIDDFSRYLELRENYRGDKKEFDRNFKAMAEWTEDYKRDNPDATDEEVSEAFRKAAEYGEKLESSEQ